MLARLVTSMLVGVRPSDPVSLGVASLLLLLTALAAALAALDDQVHIQRVVENNAIQSRDLTRALETLGYRVVPTSANFLFCDAGGDATAFAKRLHHEGVAVRPLGAWGAPNSIRVTIGTPEQNQAFLSAVRQLGSGNPTPGFESSSSAP